MEPFRVSRKWYVSENAGLATRGYDCVTLKSKFKILRFVCRELLTHARETDGGGTLSPYKNFASTGFTPHPRTRTCHSGAIEGGMGERERGGEEEDGCAERTWLP